MVVSSLTHRCRGCPSLRRLSWSRWSPLKCPPTSATQRRRPHATAPARTPIWTVTFSSPPSAWPPSTRSWTRGSTCCWGRSSCASSASWPTPCPTAPSRTGITPKWSWTLWKSRTERTTASTKRRAAKSGRWQELLLFLRRKAQPLQTCCQKKGKWIFSAVKGCSASLLWSECSLFCWALLQSHENQHVDAWQCHSPASWLKTKFSPPRKHILGKGTLNGAKHLVISSLFAYKTELLNWNTNRLVKCCQSVFVNSVAITDTKCNNCGWTFIQRTYAHLKQE